MKNCSRSGFSLVEMMLLLMIVSLMTAGSMAVITKRHATIPQKIVHGTYTCAYNDAGQLFEERFIEGKQVGTTRIIDTNAGESCVFEPPKKASYFYIQVVGAGGGGGHSGYTGGSVSSSSDAPKYISPIGITESTLSDHDVTLAEFNSIVAGYKVVSVAHGGDGGKGAQCACHYTLSTGDCLVDGSYKVDKTKAECDDLGGSWDAYARRAVVYGGDGGTGGRCSVNDSLGLNLTASSSDGAKSTDSYGLATYEDSGNDGGKGSDGEACVNGSCCTAGGAYGGKHATCKSSCPGGANPGTRGADGANGSGNLSTAHDSGIFLDRGGSENSTATNAGKLKWTHDYKKNYVTGGEGGYAGEYKTLFVRSFNTSTLTMRPGRAGVAGTSGGYGSNGEDSVLGGVLVAKGGMGGEGKLQAGPSALPGRATGTCTFGESCAGAARLDWMGRRSEFNDAANLSGMQDVQSNQMVDLSEFGRGGNGGRGVNTCWAGPHTYEFEGVKLKASFDQSSVTCSPGYSEGTAENGKPGAIVIVW